MSLYGLQKAIFEVNRDPAAMSRYVATPGSFATAYALTAEEANALSEPDVGLLYVLGVNGQLLMHFAAACGYEWTEYIRAMTEGITKYGPVREGVYAMTGRQR